MNRKVTLFIALLCITVAAISCSKPANVPNKKAVNCTITNMTDSTKTTETYYTFSYDIYGHITSINTTGTVAGATTFKYNGSTIYITYTDGGGTVYRRDTLQLNANGYISTVNDTIISLKEYYITFNYDNLGQLNNYVFVSNKNPYAASTVYYKWDFNDMINGPVNNVTSQITYTSREEQKGDPLLMSQFLEFGAYYFKPAHLPMSVVNPQVVYNFQYAFDSTNGNIKKVSFPSPMNLGTETYSYTYKCK